MDRILSFTSNNSIVLLANLYKESISKNTFSNVLFKVILNAAFY